MAASEAAPRVALLARAGDACDRIAGALREAGAELVLVADPMQAEPAQVRQAQPQAVLVALEPAIEDAIERFEDVLADPGYMVIFEEAEQAALRTGWDAARWMRHLSAKLHRHNDVLPAGAEVEDDLQLTAEPMQARPANPDFDEAIVALTDEAQHHADEVPQDTLEGLLAAQGDGLADSVPDPAPQPQPQPALEATLEAAPADEAGFDLDFSGLPESNIDADDAAASLDFASENGTPTADPAPQEDLETGLDFSTLTLSLDEGDDTELDGLSYDPERFSRAGQGEDAPAGIEEFLAAHARTAPDDADQTGVAEPALDERPAEAPAASPARVDFSSLSLVEDDDAPTAALRTPAQSFDLDALSGGLSLVDPDSYGHGTPRHGVVLIEAGLGGPDAVRQLLSALPEAFAKPILIRLALDGGRYDRLVKQMMRATSAPVSVAEAGQAASDGSIYFVPPGVGIRSGASAWIFDAGQPLDPAALLPAHDSAVLFLSGADAALVPAVMDDSWGGLVLGQTPDEGCYDPAAALAAIEAGAAHGSPVQLANMLLDRWSAPGERPNPDPNGMQ